MRQKKLFVKIVMGGEKLLKKNVKNATDKEGIKPKIKLKSISLNVLKMDRFLEKKIQEIEAKLVESMVTCLLKLKS
jgi:hypothetical protein